MRQFENKLTKKKKQKYKNTVRKINTKKEKIIITRTENKIANGS